MATYYIDVAGSNGNAGTISSPWRNLAYACANATTPYDIIHVNEGDFVETAYCDLDPRVSIEGEGPMSHVISHVANADDGENDALIRLISGSQNTDGSQYISGISLDGDNCTGGGAIFMKYRSNVSVHDCLIYDFNYSGVVFEGENSWNSEPIAFSSGNLIYNNSITNCHGGAGGGNIRFTGQTSFTMYNNNVDGRTRSMQNSITLSNNKNYDIYGNTFYTLNNRGAAFNFSFEIWDTWGGGEIRDNTFIGGGTIDQGGHYTYKGSSAFGVSIHDNTFTLPALEAYNVSEVIAITVESWATLQDIHIYNNRITNFGTGVQITFGMYAGGTAENFHIHDNIFESIGYSDTEGGSSCIGLVDQGVAVDSWNNINICHNVMTAGGSNSYKAIRYAVIGANTNITIKNNIIKGFAVGAISFSDSGGSIDIMGITNNDFYSNGANISLGGVSPSNYTNTPNYTDDPLFVSGTDFHLQSGSALISIGVVISGITTDYDGNAYSDPPSIGAYQYGGPVPESSDNPTSVPDTNTFTLGDVCDVVNPSTKSLRNCFITAGATLFESGHIGGFDINYEGNHDRLSNFRNYQS